MINSREVELIAFQLQPRQKNERLLDIICRKSSDEFTRFKNGLKETGQEIVVKYLSDVPHGNFSNSIKIFSNKNKTMIA